MTDDNGYRGPAELIVDGAAIDVEVHLAGHFDPITGSYRWYGRVAANPQLTEALSRGARQATLRTTHGEAETSLSDVDPWGRPRVHGFGTAPFEVMTSLPD